MTQGLVEDRQDSAGTEPSAFLRVFCGPKGRRRGFRDLRFRERLHYQESGGYHRNTIRSTIRLLVGLVPTT